MGRVRTRANRTHHYDQPGTYRVRVSALGTGASGPAGCSAESELTVPYDGDPDERSAAILAPLDLNELADAGEGEAPAPSVRRSATPTPRQQETGGVGGGLLDAIVRGIRSIFGG
jgi:hypothetical protein